MSVGSSEVAELFNTTLTSLTDTPSSITALGYLRGNAGGTACEFIPGPIGTTAWTGLTDTPGTITASRPVVGNSGGTALEFGGNALSDYLRRDGTNTVTGVITPNTAGGHNLGSAALPFAKFFTEQLQSVEIGAGGGTITPGAGRSALFGFVDSNGTIENNGLVDSFNMAGARAFSSAGTSLARVSGAGCAVFGDATGAYGTSQLDIDTNSSTGNFLAGATYAYYGTARIAIPGANRKGNFASGYVYQGYAGYTAKIEVATSGGFASGRITGITAGNSKIEVTASGGFAQGYIRHLGAVSNVNTSGIVASAQGGFAQGYCRDRIGGTGYIEATGKGGLAHGYVRADGETARITASGRGAVALGHARDLTTNSYITASGNGAGAFGYALNGTISATANNAFQFGPGANATASSLQVDSEIQLFGATGRIRFTGILECDPVTITATSYTAADEHVILVDDDTAGSAVTITLPLASAADAIYHVKKLGTTANVIVDGNGAETIDGAATATLTTQYESIMLVSNGSAWFVL